jgi:undecaprenyl diphosphate synthase
LSKQMSSERLRIIKESDKGSVPRHIAIIMDGNGRWAKQRGLPRAEGHRAGMKSVREAVEGCIEAGVDVLTLYAFSDENWQRPSREIAVLMSLLLSYAKSEFKNLVDNSVEVHVVGDIDRLGVAEQAAVRKIIDATRGGQNLQLVVALSYGSRSEIVRAARRVAERVSSGELEAAEIDESTLAAELYTAPWPDPDLLIRTSGEYRISNFLLWQLAYTELYSTPVLWPDFTREDLFEAILEYGKRERRYGRVTS